MRAIFRAAKACGGTDFDLARDFEEEVVTLLEKEEQSPMEIEV